MGSDKDDYDMAAAQRSAVASNPVVRLNPTLPCKAFYGSVDKLEFFRDR